MLLRCISGLALGLAVALSFPASAETEGKTNLIQLLKSSKATDDAGKSAKGKTADTKPKKKTSETAKSSSKKDKEVAASKSKKEKELAAAKAKKEKELAAAKRKGESRELVLFGGKPKEPRAAVLKKQPVVPVEALPVVAEGNSGELRSELNAKPRLFASLFGDTQPALLPETRALDASLQAKEARRKFRVKEDFVPQTVEFPGYQRGTIVVDTAARYLYLIESSTTARRYAIAVGREGLEFKGTATVGDKQEWPRWIPTKEMQEREPKKYGQYKDGMNGGPSNPLGARAIYLYQGKRDTHIRIHGTNQPETIGTNSSNGCFRMVNEHVMDLYKRVKVGTQVIVM